MRYRYRPSSITLSATLTIAALLIMTLDLARPIPKAYVDATATLFKEGTLVEDGVYGLCVECEGRIPKTRLNAIPYTAYCVKCASKLEN